MMGRTRCSLGRRAAYHTLPSIHTATAGITSIRPIGASASRAYKHIRQHLEWIKEYQKSPGTKLRQEHDLTDRRYHYTPAGNGPGRRGFQQAVSACPSRRGRERSPSTTVYLSITSLNIVIVAFAVFLLIKGINRLKELGQACAPAAVPTTKACQERQSEVPIAARWCKFCTSQISQHRVPSETAGYHVIDSTRQQVYWIIQEGGATDNA